MRNFIQVHWTFRKNAIITIIIEFVFRENVFEIFTRITLKAL